MSKARPQPSHDSEAQEKNDVKAGEWAPPEPVKSGWTNLSHLEIKDLIRDEEEKLCEMRFNPPEGY